MLPSVTELIVVLIPVLFVVAVLHVVLGFYAFRCRRMPAAVPFGITMFLAAIWAGALAMELASGGVAEKIFWSNVRIPATGMLAVTWLIMSIRHARLPWLNRGRIAALFIVPAITTLILWTGVFSALYRYNFRLDAAGLFPTLVADTGPWYWVAGVFYGQSMIYVSVVLLVRSLRGAPSLYRKQTAMIILAGLVPVMIELFSQLVPRLRGGSFTPVIFAFTGTLVALSLFRYRVFDIVLIARDLVLENMRGLVFVLDGKGLVVDLNPAAQRAIGLTSPIAIGRTAEQLLSDWVGLPIGLDAKELTVGEMDKRHVYAMEASPIKNNEDDLVGRVLLIHDITERKRMEEELAKYTRNLEQLVGERTSELRSTKDRLNYLIKSNPAVIYSGKPLPDLSDFQLTYLSERVVGMLGFKPEEFIGHPEFWKQHVPPEDQKEIQAHMFHLWKEGQYALDYQFLHKDGSYRWIREEANVERDVDGKPADVYGYWTDATERKKLEGYLSEAQRLVAIGQTAAMVGHDLRNPLQAIATTLHLLRKQFESLPSDQKQDALELLDSIQTSVQYMDKIVSDLQAYAEPRILKLAPVNLKQLLNESLQMAQMPSNIKLSLNVTEEPVLADQSITRVFMNLITNAVQAMPNGGELTIGTVREGKQVLISFQDTGVGISKEDLQKIFDPLFTTKAQGQGLGLAVCKRIVEAHEGTITVESTLGKGSRFTVKLKHER